jgi:hypothetical protein
VLFGHVFLSETLRQRPIVTVALAMGELKISNCLLGDRAALDRAWERYGYWYFRNVLDTAAVARLRRVFMNVLHDLGVADRDDPEARFTGASLEQFPHRMDPLVKMQPWKAFVAEPPIHRFFTQILGDEPFWVPTVEYRATPPTRARDRSRFDFIHQDGFYNSGIPFLICWVPLARIDDDIGGVALVEGMHRKPYLHDLNRPPLFEIPGTAIAPEAWRRSTYQAGDVLLMDLGTPHSGLANYSDRFRLSIDMRVMPRSGKVPIIGQLTAVSSSAVAVCSETGETELTINESTYCRDLSGRRMTPAAVPTHFKVGDEVIVASENGITTVLRHTH